MSNLNDNVGFWDSVLIENLTEETFISNIYQRYKRGLIYVSVWFIHWCFISRLRWGWICNFWFSLNADIHRCLSRRCKSIQTSIQLLYRCHSNVCQIELLQTTASYVSMPLLNAPLTHQTTPTILNENFTCSYGLTNLAYRSLLDQNENQCICVLGEKSSGKTESVRLILHFLTNSNKEYVPSGGTKSNTLSSTAATLMRCKSLASYPSPSHELPTTRIGSTKCIRDVDRLRENVENNFTHQYKSLDDVSKISKCQGNNSSSSKLTQPNTSVTFKPLNQKHNCDDRKNNLTALLHGEKTPVRTRKLLIAKRDLHHQCERCGYVQLNGIINDNKWSSRTPQLSDKERSSNKCVSENAFGSKSTNLKKHRSVSTQSLGYRYDANDDAASRTLKNRIVSSLVLLEAFGNASDSINSNSSRFVSIEAPPTLPTA